MHSIELESIDLLEELVAADYFLLEEGVEDTLENYYKEYLEGLQSWVDQKVDSEQIPLRNIKWLVEHPEKIKETLRDFGY